MAEELDDIGRETAAVMRQMLQLATLVALRTRERGQKEAEARAKVTETRMKETRERALREAAESKAKDPRNQELARLLARPAATQGISLEKDRSMVQSLAAEPPVRYDSRERREALAQHLSRAGVAPDLVSVRMLLDVGQATPAQEAARTVAEDLAKRQTREAAARALERSRTR
ncbi:hypothetical protein [Nocardia stercoris]|uniref:Uncharacterized protein n=1 Tax=Nocardia stercoris TaxID=2483361 RepID=A0A3M2L1L6_9NOCA|nr:hypothetical protein [Nocardia stercoris]RMI30620.1 hypothetical protein EBN03_21395 [Nocardia stercoris]